MIKSILERRRERAAAAIRQDKAAALVCTVGGYGPIAEYWERVQFAESVLEGIEAL